MTLAMATTQAKVARETTLLLDVEGVVAGYGPGDEVLKGVDLRVDTGEIVAILGPNGAGKSTLVKTIAGLLAPSRGSIVLDGQSVGGREARDIARLGVAYVPQEQNIFPTMSVRENLEIGGYVDPKASARRIDQAFSRFPMLARRRRVQARALSGGERQVLAMAMALMVEPKLLLLDEPSAGLSPLSAERLFADIAAINEAGMSIAMVEQNAREALTIADRAYILVDGRNHRDGRAASLAAEPDIRRIFLGG
ncbi:MAG TPA: ABC transporter ATP-binding protein [Casimicrobiaceae bacterium]|nr:ABC transporter ATP-binding protein [Casimicrobiaceae bacterium]